LWQRSDVSFWIVKRREGNVTDDVEDQHSGRNWFGGNKPRTHEERRALRKRVVLLGIGVVVLLFAILNFSRVKVNWIVTSGRTPLIIVIAVSFVLGVAADRLAIERIKRRRRSES
jgi:uncharacterized integral membrane protein